MWVSSTISTSLRYAIISAADLCRAFQVTAEQKLCDQDLGGAYYRNRAMQPRDLTKYLLRDQIMWGSKASVVRGWVA